MIMAVIFDERDCEMCIHGALCEDFPTCPFFEEEEESEECRNWQLDFSKI